MRNNTNYNNSNKSYDKKKYKNSNHTKSIYENIDIKNNQVAKANNNKYKPKPYKKPYKKNTINQIFDGNLARNMNFGGKGHDLSGYVERTLMVKDRNGNVQVAKEKQFFNSSKNGMRVRINKNDKE